MPHCKYKFKDFSINLIDETLSKDDEIQTLTRRAFQVLLLLVENAGEIVRKEDFFEKVWQGNAVEENNLTVAIAQIRKILGQNKENKFIETVPLKGYRFVSKVEKVFTDAEQNRNANAYIEETKSSELVGFFKSFIASRKVLAGVILLVITFSISAFWFKQSSKSKSEPFQSLAVLPFSADKRTPDNEVFAEKLTQELINNLGRITEIRLSGYEAVSIYHSPEVDLTRVGKDLQVDGLITGKIEDSGDLEIKINDLRNGESIFVKNYSLKPQDLADSQFRIARDIARELGKNKETNNQSATANLEAYQAYLLARHHLNKSSTKELETSVQQFTEATIKDPKFAEAFAGMATAHILHGSALYGARGLSASRKSFPSAKENAQKALELKNNSDEALTALAFVQYRHDFDWKNAEVNFRKAIEINPNNVRTLRWFGEFLHCFGRFDEGFAIQQKALQLEPNSPKILSEIAWGNYLAKRFEEAEKYAQKSHTIDKTHASTLYNLSEIYEQKGNYDEAVALWKEAMIIESAARKWIANLEQSYQKNGQQGFAKAKAEWLEDLIEKDYVYPTDLAKCYAMLGDKNKAIDWLEKGFEARVPDFGSIKYIPAFDSIKNDSRFINLLAKMNLPQ